MNKYVKLSMVTLLGLIMVTSFIFGSIFIANPAKTAEFFETLEMDNFAYAIYNVAYRNTSNIKQQHFMLKTSIDNQKSKNIVYYSEMLMGNNTSNSKGDFDTLIEEIDLAQRLHHTGGINSNWQYETNIVKRQATNNSLIAIASEEAYIKRQYISALISTGRVNEAFEFAKQAQTDATTKIKKSGAYDDVFLHVSFYFSAFDETMQLRAQDEILDYYIALKAKLKSESLNAITSPGSVFGPRHLMNLLVLNNTIFKVASMFNSLLPGVSLEGNNFATDMVKSLAAQNEVAKPKTSPITHPTTNQTYNGEAARISTLNWV